MGKFLQLLDIIKTLCLKIRKILFPLNKNKEISFGALAGDPNQFYSPIIATFNNAIKNI